MIYFCENRKSFRTRDDKKCDSGILAKSPQGRASPSDVLRQNRRGGVEKRTNCEHFPCDSALWLYNGKWEVNRLSAIPSETATKEEVSMESRNRKGKWIPWRVTLVYAFVGILWMLFSDFWLDSSILSGETYDLIQNIKGILFIFLTSVAIYFCVKYFIEKNHRVDQERTELLRINHQLTAVADHLKSSVLILDPHGEDASVAFANQEFTKLTGYSFDEVRGKPFRFFQGNETAQAAIEKCEWAIKTRNTATVEFLGYRKDKTSFWNEMSISPIFDANGQLLFFIILQNDITKRKIAERKLLESEQRYKSLFEHNPELVCASNKEGVITSVNPAVKKMTGYEVDEVVGQTCRHFIDDGNWEETRSFLRKALEGHPRQGQFHFRHKDGHQVDLEAVVLPMVVDNQIVGMYTIAKDVTKYNKAQELLRKAEKLNVVGELAAGIAHEIRNPLTSLKGFIQLLRPSLTEKKAYTDVMISELQRIEQIVTELLLLAKPQAVQFEKKNLRQLLEHVRTLLNTKAIMSNIGILLNYQCETAKIFCEENQLKQVLINLLKNAIEAMPSGGEIFMEAENIDEKSVCIRVIDQGCGIPENNLAKLGEPFYTTKQQGTGLGLMISQKIIREHGGSMQFISRENEGTTVEIKLPVSPEIPTEVENKYQITG